MITLSQITLQRGKKVLLKNASAAIFAKEKIGLIGRNGCGKSSLFSLLLGELTVEAGDVQIQANLKIAHLSQTIPNSDLSAIEFVMQGDKKIYDLWYQLKIAEEKNDSHQIGELHHKIYEANGYDARARAGKLLNGLCFKPYEHEKRVSEFSGGWRMRLNLAKVLMCPSDLLLLDEPTNHLDLDAIIWLEDWLKKYEGVLLLISHDREFLDHVVNRVIHVENQALNAYTGNYSQFETQRAMKLLQNQAMYQRQQNKIEQTMQFVRRFSAKASKAKQAQSRLKALNRLEIISQANIDTPFNFTFKPIKPSGAPLLQLEDVNAGYGDLMILEKLKISINPGDRIGLLGHNGAGKSTLIKTLAGQLPILHGEIYQNKGLSTGYFAQHQVDQLHLDQSPLWHFQQFDSKATIQTLRNFLGGFDFYGDMAMSKIEHFSGGEKARLVLALIVWQSPNLLLLDEPTNHLDLDMREALTIALQSYEGAVVLVSHDRHLLQTSVDQFWLVHQKAVTPFDDDLDAYAKWVLDKQNSHQQEGSPSGMKKSDQKIEKRSKPKESSAASIELKLEKLYKEKEAIDLALTDSAIYEKEHQKKLDELIASREKISKEIEMTEKKWTEIID
jgi:ATP-binding cassette subfamily F protein 3